MKKLLALTLALVLALSLAACGGNTDTPSGSTGTPGNSQGGNDTAGWASTFETLTGIPNLPTPTGCEVSSDKTSSRTVTFTANAEITDDQFTAYAGQVFDLIKASSPDGNYDINYDGFVKGDAYGSFADVSVSSKYTYWYYTFNGYISQIAIDGKGSSIVVKVNDVYNTDTGERAKP